MRPTFATRRKFCGRFETLEVRQVLSVLSGPEVSPNLLMIPAATNAAGGIVARGNAPAYGFNNISFNGVAGDGRGQTIAIVDAYNDPNILSDLAKFDGSSAFFAAES